MIHEENDVLINDEFAAAKDFLKQLKHACLYIRNEHPRWFKMLCSTPAINMKDKQVVAITKQKDPKRHKAAKKGHDKDMNRLKESILSSQAPEYVTNLMSLLPMMLVMVESVYLLATFKSIQLCQLLLFACFSTVEQVNTVLPLFLERWKCLQ